MQTLDAPPQIEFCIPIASSFLPETVLMNTISLRILCIGIVFLTKATASAQETIPSDQLQFFETKIRPVLAQECYGCHSQKAPKTKGGLVLDSVSGWKLGGESGEPAILPGDPDHSPLWKAMTHQDGLAMPPDKKLPDAILADFRRWIAMGAPDPRTDTSVEIKRADKNWWSLQPIAPSELPEARFRQWDQPIDRLVGSMLATKDLAPNPPAPLATLLRRIHYTLTGLPPTWEDHQQFQTQVDQIGRQRALEALIDRLLDSRAYAEHWGRHWLDVIRFGESIGFERNVIIDDLWPFRDYVIRSIQQDKPFDQFIREHLAGDVIGRDNPSIEIGTAFLVSGPYDDVGNQDPVAQANIRAATLDEIITASTSAFLGLTVSCARCHHHKFDPIPSEDYYRVRAAFEGIQHGRRILASPQEKNAHDQAVKPLHQKIAEVDQKIQSIENAITARCLEWSKTLPLVRPKIAVSRTEETFAPIEAKYLRFTMHSHTGNPRSAVGSRLVEFEVWSSGPQPINVALQKHGGIAEGAKAIVAEDFPDAYSASLVNDGRYGEQWMIGNPAELRIQFKDPSTIDRIVFSNARTQDAERREIEGETPCEYSISVSIDGKTWTEVASSSDRQAWSDAHASHRVRHRMVRNAEQKELESLRRESGELRRQLENLPKLKQVFAGIFQQPGSATFFHQGGDPMKPGKEIAPASLSFWNDASNNFELPSNAPESDRRLALAKWITHPKNPLTPRVLANRIWHYHFGTGIVDTPSDFGFLGGRPSNEKLLDYLARRLLEGDWKIKALHREILLSETFQQSSDYREDAGKVDRDSRTLWRFPPRRLAAEEIRDTILSIAGKLKLEEGGPGFRLYKFTQNNVCTYFPLDHHGPETYRRAVYHQNARASVVDLLSDFDFPDIAFSSPRRSQTTTPLQALTLLNHSFTVDMAESIASQIESASTDLEARVTHGYRIILARQPSAREQSASRELLQRYGTRAFCRALLNLNELIYVE